MPKVKFLYGRESLEYDVPDRRLRGTLVSEIHNYKAPKSGPELVKDALAMPVASPKLSELAKGRKKIVLIASDHTRPVPSKVMVPQMLEEIRKGSPGAEITIAAITAIPDGMSVIVAA